MLATEMALRTLGICRSSARSSGFGWPSGVIREVGAAAVNADACGTIPPRRGEADVLIENCLPLAIYPFLQVGPFVTNGGVEAMSWKNDGVGWKREQFRIY